MASFPSRSGALVLGLAAGFLAGANAQTPAPDDMVHTDAKGRHLAPRDTFYTTEYVSARTDKGVEGFPPGTEVHLVSVNQEAHTLTVSDGHAQVEVPPSKLTHDMDIAALIKAQDQAGQERVAQYEREEALAYQKYEKEVTDYTARDLEEREQAIKDAEVQPKPAEVSAAAESTDTAAYNNGYYGEGGYGYGIHYVYFTNGYRGERRIAIGANRNDTGGGKGAL